MKMLLMAKVSHYLEFKIVEGSYVWKKGGKVHKVPATEKEALATGLMGFFEKRRFRNLLMWIMAYNVEDEKTWNGLPPSSTMREAFKKFGCDENTIDFTGHALCLYTNDDYIDRPIMETIARVRLYRESMARFKDAKSPFIYPLYGLGELPQAFARSVDPGMVCGASVFGCFCVRFVRFVCLCLCLCVTVPLRCRHFHNFLFLFFTPCCCCCCCCCCGCCFSLSAIYGGTYMLDKPIDEVVYEDGKVTGVRSGDDVAKAKIVIGSPSYFPDKVKKNGQVVRAICLLDHPIPNTNNATSCQIIIPGNQVGRKHDVYVACISFAHKVASKDKYVAICSTTVETGNPEAELACAFDLIGATLEKFVSVDDVLVPTDDGSESNVFITESYDATSHFETTCLDVAAAYKRATGEELGASLSCLRQGEVERGRERGRERERGRKREVERERSRERLREGLRESETHTQTCTCTHRHRHTNTQTHTPRTSSHMNYSPLFFVDFDKPIRGEGEEGQ